MGGKNKNHGTENFSALSTCPQLFSCPRDSIINIHIPHKTKVYLFSLVMPTDDKCDTGKLISCYIRIQTVSSSTYLIFACYLIPHSLAINEIKAKWLFRKIFSTSWTLLSYYISWVCFRGSLQFLLTHHLFFKRKTRRKIFHIYCGSFSRDCHRITHLNV